jgi:hypothetical protein
LLAARTALANIVEASKNDSKEDLISFIRNEASDYQVMHLLLQGTLPKEKYNPVAEATLFSYFKESMLMNKDFVTEMVGEDIFDNVLNEVDSLYMTTSTAKPVLEFAAQTDFDSALSLMITENPAQDAAVIKNLKAKIMNWANDLRDASGPAKQKIAAKIASAKKALAAKAAAVKGAVSPPMSTAPQAKLHSMKGANTAIAKHKAKTLLGKGQAAAGKAGAAISKFATSKAGMATGGAAAAALAIYAGYKIYKRFFSQAAKSCAGQSGAAKTACMNKFKKQAIMKQASAIQAASGTCAKSKDPAKCKAAVGKKVASLKAKAAAISA